MSNLQVIGFKPSVQLNILDNEDFILPITIRNKNTKLPIDITNFTFSGDIKKLITDTAIFKSFTFDKVDAPNGKVEAIITLPELQALTLPTSEEPKSVFDMRYFEGTGGRTKVFLTGLTNFMEGVTS